MATLQTTTATVLADITPLVRAELAGRLLPRPGRRFEDERYCLRVTVPEDGEGELSVKWDTVPGNAYVRASHEDFLSIAQAKGKTRTAVYERIAARVMDQLEDAREDYRFRDQDEDEDEELQAASDAEAASESAWASTHWSER